MARDLYLEVTEKIIAQLEAGTIPWIKPWACASKFGGQPFNAISRKPYRGINTLLLCAPQYARTEWMTYKQAQDIGANVRKGETGSMIVFYKPFAVKDKNAKPDADGNVKERNIPLLRCFHVFNLEQIENLPECLQAQRTDDRPELERHAMADSVMAQASVSHGGDRAFYRVDGDSIRLPQPGQFDCMASYYGTALHELTHWTGHKSRLDREYGKRFGDQAYAREELVAEMGAAFLCASVGIAGKLQHPQYVANWLTVLKGDKRAVLVAAGAAQKAADFCLKAIAEIHADEGEELAA